LERAAPLDKCRKGDIRQILFGEVLKIVPDTAHDIGRAVGSSEGSLVVGPFKGPHDVEERNALGLSGELVSALRSPSAAHQAGATKRAEELVQVRLWNPLALSNIPTLKRTTVTMSSELIERSDAVIQTT
jgi:hypothetical protein